MATWDTYGLEEGASIFNSPTFEKDLQIRVNQPIGSATIAPSGRDVALASKHGLYIIDLDSPLSPPRHIRHESPWTPADVQWSPFASRYYWVVSTSNQRALVWNLELSSRKAPIEFVLHAHSRAITDINFSPFHPDVLSTCAVDSFIHTWDLRIPGRPAISFSDWFAGASQVKWNRRDSHIIASSHDRFLRIWDDRKGAIPLTSIEAHATKIYGVDWSRLDDSRVVTCSLDRTIKIWDYSLSDDHPERVIQTPYPVWRARHTPFGEGILAMPQRGDHKLHLFEGKKDLDTPSDALVDPVYTFKGHSDSVKEFLWRARGTILDNIDERDFQLVTWGSDRHLILHKMRDKYFRQVGHERGMRVQKYTQLTRRGSPYKSFRDIPATTVSHMLQGHPAWEGRDPVSPDLSREYAAPKTTTMSRPAEHRQEDKKSTSAVITWMKGVKFGKGNRPNTRNARRSLHLLSKMNGRSDSKETLSDEIIYASDTFTKITFEEVDVKNRHLRLSLNGPWGASEKQTLVTVDMNFPKAYPESACPVFAIGRSSTITMERIDQLEGDLGRIAQAHVPTKLGCLDSVLSFLTGEHTLKQSIAWLSTDDEEGHGIPKDDSSSDEEDGIGEFVATQSQVLGSGDAPTLSLNANVPIPKACGAIWAPNGSLICFFPPRAQPPSLFDKLQTSRTSKSKSDVMHEGFGMIQAKKAAEFPPRSPPSNDGTPEDSEIEDDESMSNSSTSTSSSSAFDEEITFPTFQGSLYRRKAWTEASQQKHNARSTSVAGSQRISAAGTRGNNSPQPKTIVSIQIHDDVLPAKQALAEAYTILSDPVTTCKENGRAALEAGFVTIAEIWSLLELVLTNDVPLTSLAFDGQHRAFIMAKRALVSIKKQDSGLDLSFDEPQHVMHPHFWGHLKWAGHPFSADWLIDRIFEHFEREADIQMLAMLACVLDDGDDDERDNRSSNAFRSNVTPEWYSHVVPYFPSEEVADFAQKPLISISASGQALESSFGTYGSVPSSDGFRGQDSHGGLSSELPTPLSGGSTPPYPLSRNNTNRSSIAASMSVSPETKSAGPLSANSSFAVNVFSRPFQLSSSPPTRNRLSGEENLATSLPSSSGITWGSIKIHGSNTTMRPSYLASESEILDTDSPDEDEPLTPNSGVKVTLHNQMRFEDEGGADLPLLSPAIKERCNAYRAAYAACLDSWGLWIKATEMRKFNTTSGTSMERDHFQDHTPVVDDSTSQVTMIIGKEPVKEDTGAGLVVTRLCKDCSSADVNKKKESRCSRCESGKDILGCGVCHEPIRGLHKACLSCGHAAHMDCLVALQQVSEDMEEAIEYLAAGTCESGCGCECSAFGALDLTEVESSS